MRHWLAAGGSFAALASLAAAQTFVVDAANGPGAQYTTIAAAVAAVPDGATVLVRPGQYGSFHVQAKGLTLLGGPGVLLPLAIAQPASIQVSATTSAQPVVIRGITTSGATQLVQVTDCAGFVLLEDVADGPRGPTDFPSFVSITRSPQVLVRGLQIGMGTVTTTDSHVVMESCSILGANARYGGVIWFSQPGVWALRGSLQVVACTLQGGNGDTTFGSNRPGIEATNADLRVRAPATLRTGAATHLPRGPAIDGTGTLRIDPAVVLVTSGTPIGTGLTTQTYVMPAVLAASSGPGGTLSASVHAPTAAFAVLILGFSGAPLTVSGITGSFWIDPATCFCAAFGVPQPAVPLTATVAVPANAAYLGARVAWQSVSAVGSGLEASNPTQSLVR